jgi:hypothetical protein
MKFRKSISERNVDHNKKVAELKAMLENEGETKKYKRLKKVADQEDGALMKDYKELAKEADKTHNIELKSNSNLF